MYESWTIISHRDLDFSDDKGNQVKGVQLFMCRPCNDRGWHGVEVSKFFIRDGSEVLAKPLPKPGTIVQIGFNRFGKISYIEEA